MGFFLKSQFLKDFSFPESINFCYSIVCVCVCVYTHTLYICTSTHTHSVCQMFYFYCFILLFEIQAHQRVLCAINLVSKMSSFSCDRNICVYSVRIPLLEPTVFLNCLLLYNPVAHTRNSVALLSPPLSISHPATFTIT